MCAQPSLDPRNFSCIQEISYTALPADFSQGLCAEAQRWQQITQAAGKPVTLAVWMSWHFAVGQGPAWCSSLETHLQVPAFLLGRGYMVRRETLPGLPHCSQQYFLQK